jgi:hypothetical protein
VLQKVGPRLGNGVQDLDRELQYPAAFLRQLIRGRDRACAIVVRLCDIPIDSTRVGPPCNCSDPSRHGEGGDAHPTRVALLVDDPLVVVDRTRKGISDHAGGTAPRVVSPREKYGHLGHARKASDRPQFAGKVGQFGTTGILGSLLQMVCSIPSDQPDERRSQL